MGRHRTDGVSLFFGVLFAGAGLVVLLDGAFVRPGWLRDAWPLLLVLLGLWILVATALGRERAAVPALAPSDVDGQPPDPEGQPSDAREPDETDRSGAPGHADRPGPAAGRQHDVPSDRD